MQRFDYESMGTNWEITIWDPASPDRLRGIKEEIKKESEEFDNTYSRFKKDSLVWKIAESPGAYEVPEDFLNMLNLYMDLYLPSEKKLNPLLGFAISDLGYDENYSLKQKENIRPVPDLLETVKIIGDKIEVKEKVLFDFGALGKGYFVDKITSILKREKIEKFLVNGSGDIYYHGIDAIEAGLEDPEDGNKVIGKISIKNQSLCASGTNRRKWSGKNSELNHELDATTLEPADFILATWVVAETCALADALATCLFFVTPENFSKYDFEYLIMNKNREIKKSPGFEAELF